MASDIAQHFPITFADVKGWANDSHLGAFKAFLKTAKRAARKPYSTHSLGVDAVALQSVSTAALNLNIETDVQAREFFETHFVPHIITGETGHVTGYYEPVVEASRLKTETHRTPLLARPDDLIDLDEDNRPDDLAEHIRFGHLHNDGRITAYFPRGQIEGDDFHNGALAGRGLELCWIEDPMDAYFIHIQGSAKLQMTDGSVMRVTYAAKSGHDYTSIGKELLATGYLAKDDLTMTSLRRWFRENPDKRTSITWRNDSYIFFHEVNIENEGDGPIAAAKVPLSNGRSLAVDRLIHTYGTPVWIDVEGELPSHDEPVQRLMIAQDTGSAIIGSSRGDIFVGSGFEAGEIAGAINHQASFVVFVPKPIEIG